ncbi:MAG: hypothetical protein IKO99_03880 [Bacteroidales bacterium]|nr:hypothetical protein [Bacteroidales bacterium]
MRNFWIYLGCLAAVMLLYLFGGECLVRQVPNPYKYKHEWMKKHQGEVEILTFGGSHSWEGIKPEILGKNGFCLANSSQMLQYDDFLFFNYDCPNLKEVVIAISYPTLFADDYEYDETRWFYCIYYKIYMDCPYHSNFSKYNFEFSNPKSFQDKLKQYFRNAELNSNEYGNAIFNTLENKDTVRWNNGSEAKEAATRHNGIGDFSHIETNLARLQKITDYCENHGIKLVLVTTPCWKLYVDNLDSIRLSKMQEVMVDYCKRNPKVLYLNYLTDERFVADDYYNSDHLSTIGAIKFTKILKEDIERH